MSNMWKGSGTRTSVTVSAVRFAAPLSRSHSGTSTKGVTLTRSRIALMAALVTVAAVATGSALAAGNAKIVPYNVTYTGLANVVVADGLSTITATGVGKGTPVLLTKLTGKGNGSADENAECNPFNGTGTITGLKGAKMNFKLSGAQGCGDGEQFSITGRAHRRRRSRGLQDGQGQPQGRRQLEEVHEGLLDQVHRKVDGLAAVTPRSRNRRNR